MATKPDPQANPAASALAALRRTEPRTCTVCGRVFIALPTARTCSPACSQRAYRERQRSNPPD